MPKVVTGLLTAMLLCASAAEAQTCLGLPSFASGFVHLNAVGEFPDSATAYAVGIGAGRPNELFGNIGGGQTSYEGFDEKSTFGFLELGYQLPLGRAQVCPVAGLYLGSGPNDDLVGFTVSTRGITAGGAVGVPVSLPRIARVLTLVPNAALRYEYLAVNVDEENIGSYTDSYNSGVLDIGLGFVFLDRFAVQPLVHIPFGGDDDEISLAVFASVSIGWRDR